MNQGMYPLAATMINQLNRVDVLSNNLANANTYGFKQDNLAEGSFNNYLVKAQAKNEPINNLSNILNIIPKIDSKYLDQSLGAITPTNNQFDFAINSNDMFFKVKDPKTGNIFLTRDGSFARSNTNQLITKNGYQVLNKDNQPILTEEIDFGISILVVKTNYDNLDKVGNNNYKIKDNTKVQSTATNEGIVLQGSIERSNVNSVMTMVSLIDTHRRFEQAQKAMNGIDDLNQQVISKIGDNR